jgi:hypothetical protein
VAVWGLEVSLVPKGITIREKERERERGPDKLESCQTAVNVTDKSGQDF